MSISEIAAWVALAFALLNSWRLSGVANAAGDAVNRLEEQIARLEAARGIDEDDDLERAV